MSLVKAFKDEVSSRKYVSRKYGSSKYESRKCRLMTVGRMQIASIVHQQVVSGILCVSR
jgi:hypothetical protein